MRVSTKRHLVTWAIVALALVLLLAALRDLRAQTLPLPRAPRVLARRPAHLPLVYDSGRDAPPVKGTSAPILVKPEKEAK